MATVRPWVPVIGGVAEQAVGFKLLPALPATRQTLSGGKEMLTTLVVV